ncbi:polycystin-1 [Salarias fasciatus]|uniref:polycystin-1 n=1 Tax=Salarias fasciatus TaxID=181472 RepID=UPI0011767620|nr:polycystin-1-like [Salarias fasciatus]
MLMGTSQVTASNPISSQSQQILLTADEAAPLGVPEFLSVTEVAALDVSYIYTIRVKVDISLPVTIRWDFGDSSINVVHTKSAPCHTTKEVEETGVKQVYIHDSVNYTYSIPGTPLLAQRKTTITVVHSPLVAVIKGGSHRLWSSLSDLVLDGSDSQDPDMEPGEENMLHYHWAFTMAHSAEAHFVKRPTVSVSSRMTILSTQLQAGSIYIFTLTVHKDGRSASINQTVTVTEAPVLPVSIECISCSSAYHVSYTNPVVLTGHCGQCGDRAQPVTGRWGKASLKIQPNSPPHGGLCDLSPQSDIRLLETMVTFNCSVLDVDQISSALSQSTVLESVGKMIHVLKKHTSPTVFPVVNAGRNILSVIGSTLAAVSKSGSPQPPNTRTLQAHPGIGLLGFRHVGELMRILMQSRVHGETPLALSTNYITTVGFHGSPSELLCTQPDQHHVAQSKSPSGLCQFHIPASFTAHLQSNRSEVVQVLYGTGGALESDVLLAEADPPISTNLVAMELATHEGQPIPIQDLEPEQAIRVTLPNRRPVDQGGGGWLQFYNLEERRWSSRGLHPLEGSTLRAAHCLTQHLTMFGASVFVHPGAVVLLPPSGGPVRNVLVGIVCAALVLIHLLVGLIAHKLDHMDSLRLSQVPLCGRPGLFHYRVLVKTGWRPGAGTTAHVGISLYGVNKSGSRHLQRDGAFQRGSLDQFHVETDDNLGEVWKIRIWHDNTGLDPSWYVQHVVVWDPQTDHMFFFLVEDWLSLDNQKTGTVEKEVLASCPEELSQFRRVLSSQMVFGLMERHLWLSLWERPAHSRFSMAQRVTCAALLLHLYLAFGAVWYGAVGTKEHSEPVSARLLVNVETIAVGMTIAALVFPLQCFLCFLFRKAHSQVTVDMSVPPSPVCHSVEMDVNLGQSGLSGPSFLSLPDSSGKVRDSPSSLMESKALDSSILDFWAFSGLTAGTHDEEEGVVSWQSCDSLLNSPTNATSTPDGYKASPARGTARQLRRKKAVMQLHLAIPALHISPANLTSPPPSHSQDILTSAKLSQRPHHMIPDPTRVGKNNLTSLLTLSEEDLLMSIAAAEDTAHAANSNSDSGRDSPRTMSSFSTRSDSCNSWSEQSEEKSLYGAATSKPDIQSDSTPNGPRLYKCPSVLSVDSVASTFLPSPSPDSTRSPSTTRIGVVRGQPGRLLPPWALSALYLLVALLLGACLAAVGLYGSFFSSKVVLAWLASAVSAFLTSALLLEPLQVCVQALVHTALWRPVDPEVEEQLARETTVVRAFGEQSGKVRPPCGYGLLQAKEEARKVQALRALMRHCVCQLLFLLLVLLVSYQDGVEQRQARLLRSAVRQRLHAAPPGFPNLTSLRDWSDTEQWISHTLLPHLHQNPILRLVGSPQLRYTHLLGTSAIELQGNESETRRLVADLRMAGTKKKTQFQRISIDFTHHHRESGLFMCVSVRLAQAEMQPISSSLAINPLVIPSSSSEPDLQFTLTIFLLASALLVLFGELRSVAAERAQYLYRCHHWFQLLLALLTLAAAVLQLRSQSLSSSCLSKFRARPRSFINFHRAALLAEKSSQCAALLLTLLVLKLLGTLRFVRRWVVIGRVLQRAWRELRALAVLVVLLLLLCTHLGNTLFSGSVEGFLSLRQTSVSVLSILRGRPVLQRLCRVHPVLGPLYGLLLLGGCAWFLARLCGAVLIRTYRAEQAELFQPTIEPQDYEMVEFFIKRLKLWMGLTKAKQFRHRVKFEGMDAPPSRASQESRLSSPSSPSSPSSSVSSPRPSSSALSVRSEDSSGSETGFEVQPYLDSLMPCATVLLSRFDRVNQLIEDIHNLEVKLEEVQASRRKAWKSNKEESEERLGELLKPKEPNEGEVRHRKTGLIYPKSRISLPSSFPFISSSLQSTAASICIFPRMRSSYSESESMPLHPQLMNSTLPSEFTKAAPGFRGLSAGSPAFGRLPRRRAWHSGSSHSADATQRGFQLPGENLTSARPRSEEGPRGQISDGVPVKRKAWISEEPEIE